MAQQWAIEKLGQKVFSWIKIHPETKAKAFRTATEKQIIATLQSWNAYAAPVKKRPLWVPKWDTWQ